MRRAIVASFAVVVVLGAATAGATETETVPPSTNPANRVVYPANGQDAEQQCGACDLHRIGSARVFG